MDVNFLLGGNLSLEITANLSSNAFSSTKKSESFEDQMLHRNFFVEMEDQPDGDK